MVLDLSPSIAWDLYFGNHFLPLITTASTKAKGLDLEAPTGDPGMESRILSSSWGDFLEGVLALHREMGRFLLKDHGFLPQRAEPAS